MRSELPGQEWFEIASLAAGVWAIGEPRQEQEVYSFLIEGADRAVLVDSGTGAADIAAVAASLTNRPVALVNSHSHWDHIGNNWRFSDISIHELEADRLPLGVGQARLAREFTPSAVTGELPPGFDPATFHIPSSHATTRLRGGEKLDLGERTLHVIHAPGHSPGGIVLLDERNGLLFSTDVAYPGPIYAFGDDADWPLYLRSMQMLAGLAGSVRSVHGSHNNPTMEPAMLVAMRDAFERIEAGLPAETDDGRLASYGFDGFSVLRPSLLNEERGVS